MESSKPDRTVVVFDLDDTLYKEADYQDSGLRHVCDVIKQLYWHNSVADLMTLRSSKETDLLGGLCRMANLPPQTKESLLWTYRLHRPRISLEPTVRQTIDKLLLTCRLAILTDGRSVSQRLKLIALGLDAFPAYVSEEHGSEKPNLKLFELVMKDIPGRRYFYIGDNPRKDFVGPNQLGWETICLRGDERNIHSQSLDGIPVGHLPHIWIDSIEGLIEIVC